MKNCLHIKKFQFTSSGGPWHGMVLYTIIIHFRHDFRLNFHIPSIHTQTLLFLTYIHNRLDLQITLMTHQIND